MWVSPAKINLFLHVVRRRSDHYHELASLFQAISLCDFLHLTLSDVDHLFCNHPSVPQDSSNLIWKAIDLYRKKTGKTFKVKIILDKHIPIEAGLGGGSSNAATALWAVNELMGFPVSTEELLLWSAEIGSDVPFFFSEGTAYCTGRGEKVCCLPPLKHQSLWIMKPKLGLSTAAVFKSLNLMDLPKQDPDKFLKDFIEGSPCYFNDLEKPAFALLPQLLTIKQNLLKQGFKDVCLTGTGTAFTCFGEPEHHPEAFFQCSAQYINREKNKWYSL